MNYFEQILDRYGRSEESIDKAFENSDKHFGFLINAIKLADSINRSNSQQYNVALNNLVVNLVIFIENSLKNIVYMNPDIVKLNPKGVESLLKNKITISEAFNLFQENKITKIDLITSTANFQNINSINRFFTILIDGDYLGELGAFSNVKFGLSESLNTSNSKWIDNLEEVFNWRHDFIHHNKLIEASPENHEKVSDLIALLFSFIKRSALLINYKIKNDSKI